MVQQQSMSGLVSFTNYFIQGCKNANVAMLTLNTEY